MKHVLTPLSRALAVTAPLWLAACSKAPEAVATAPAPVAAASAAAPAHAGIDWVKPDGASVDAIFAKAKADNKPVFLYWGAVWCPPCRKMEPILKELEKEATIVRIDGGEQDQLVKDLKISEFPTFIVYKAGAEVWRQSGLVSKDVLSDKLK